MKVTTETLENRQVEMTIEVEDERVQQALRNKTRQLAREINIPGFRKGKAPHSAVMRRVGEKALYDEVIEEHGPRWVEEALNEANLNPYRPGQMSDLQLKPLSFKIVFPLPPVVDLGDYRSLRIPFEMPAVPEEDIDNVLEEIRQRNAFLEPVGDGPAELGHIATLHIRGTTPDGETLNFSAGEEDLISVPLEEQTTFLLPGFVEQIVGMKVDEEKTFGLPVPEDFQDPTLRGQELIFTVKLEELKTRNVPSLDDALAQTLGSFQTLDELRDDLRSSMAQNLVRQAEVAYADECAEQLVRQATRIEFPPVMVEEELDKIFEEIKQRLEKQKMSLEELLDTKKQTIEEYREEMGPRAIARLKQILAIVKFVEEEGLVSPDKEMNQNIAEAAVTRLIAICKGEAPDVEAAEAPGAEAAETPDAKATEAMDVEAAEVPEAKVAETPDVEATEIPATAAEVSPSESASAPESQANES